MRFTLRYPQGRAGGRETTRLRFTVGMPVPMHPSSYTPALCIIACPSCWLDPDTDV